jgi:hypothetical protein
MHTPGKEIGKMKIRHWQDVASLVLGMWLAVSPMTLGLTGAAGWITLILGLAVMVFAIEGLLLPSYLEECGEICLGATLVASPLAVDYGSSTAIGNSVLVGMLIIVFAVWEMMTDREFQAWWYDFSNRHSA